MPPRVVTIDWEGLYGGQARLLAATIRPYNPAGLPVPLQGGHYVDAIVETDVPDVSALQANTAEYTDDVPDQWKDAGVGHTFLGWERLEFLPDPPPEGTRRTVITLDLGGATNSRLTRLDTFPVTASTRALEVLLDVPAHGNGSLILAHAYDALDDHPPALADALQRAGAIRRQTSADPPIGWEQRRGGP